MAFSKSRLYPKDAQMVSGFARAVGHAARIQILQQLSEEGECTVEELSKNHPISRPAMSCHLRILRASHLVDCEEKFPYTIYRLNGKNVVVAEGYLGDFFGGSGSRKKGRKKPSGP